MVIGCVGIPPGSSLSMSLTFVHRMRRRRHRQLCGNSILAVTCAVIVSAVGLSSPATQQLYLLAGTPTNYSTDGYPVSLYRIKAGKKLYLVRVVVPASEVLYSVQAAKDVFFVAHPAGAPSSVSIVHASDPQSKDDVVFTSDGRDSIKNREALAEPTPSSIDALFPVTAVGSDASKGTLISVPSDPRESTHRVKSNAWDEYTTLRLDGNPGGPAFNAYCCFGRIVGGTVVMSVFGHKIPVEVTPPLPRGTDSQTIIWLMVVSKEYSVLALARPGTLTASPNVETSREMLVHDRIRNSWKKIHVEGTLSRLRLFGLWLATIVGIENPDHKPGPGRENERNQATGFLPNLRDMYSWFADDNKVWMPGTLVLQNLQDDRKI
jgi:hypothetical protein